MPEVSIFQQGRIQVAGVDVDLRTGEYHTSESQVTSYAIEDGSVVADHIVETPDVVEIACQVENFDGNGQPAQGRRAKDAFQRLKQLKGERQLVEVVTQHELYTDMAITMVTGAHESPVRGRLTMRARFERLPRVQLQLVTVSEAQLAGANHPSGPAVQKSASGEVDAGRQEVNDNRSLLTQVTDAFGGTQ